MGAELLALIVGARSLISYLVTQASLLGPEEITQAQLSAIKEKAGLSDSAWDEAVAAARERESDTGG